VFFIQPVYGSLVMGHKYAAPVTRLPFASVEDACTYASAFNDYPDGTRERYILFNVTDADSVTVYSSFDATTGVTYAHGDYA
jgi:hypothetical protein